MSQHAIIVDGMASQLLIRNFVHVASFLDITYSHPDVHVTLYSSSSDVVVAYHDKQKNVQVDRDMSTMDYFMWGLLGLTPTNKEC